MGNVSGYLHCFAKLADRLRLFALFVHSAPENCGTPQAICIFFDTPMMKLVESLRLCALHARKLRNVSGFLHRHVDNGRESQAVCPFWALGSRKLGERLRLFALFYEIGRQSQAVCTFGALHSQKLGDVSGYLHCFMKLAGSLSRFALFVHSTAIWGRAAGRQRWPACTTNASSLRLSAIFIKQCK